MFYRNFNPSITFSKPLKGDDIAKCMADNQEPKAVEPKVEEIKAEEPLKNQEKNNNQPEGIHI